MTYDELWKYLIKNEDSIRASGIYIKKLEISSVDESGQYFTLVINGDEYTTGYVYITEDDETWAQAESYLSNFCNKSDNHIKCDELYNRIVGIKSENRENLINKII
jgi:hypothetical protein